MLSELTIENIAVIQKATVTFDGGFNVLTGETGAGKSIIIDAVSALLGNRLAKELIRSGATKATIQAVFTDIDDTLKHKLSDMGFVSEDTLIVSRDIAQDGKGTVRINGKTALVSMLKEVVAGLIEIHGQQDNISLTSPATHLALLDRFGGLGETVGRYTAVYRELCALIKQRDALLQSESDSVQRADFLRFQIGEIEAADLKEGEAEQLSERRKQLQNLERLTAALSEAHLLLTGEEHGALTATSAAVSALQPVSTVSERLGEKYERLSSVYYELQELSGELSEELSSLDTQPDELPEIEQRLSEYYRMRQKYGGGYETIMKSLSDMRQELGGIDNADELVQELSEQIDQLGEKATAMCADITSKRKAAFARLQKQTVHSLEFLNMSGIKFELKCEHKSMSRDGANSIEFLISTNAGEVPKPLGKIASGGELARIMLALKNSLADVDDTKTVIYDEIDTGVSGSAAYKIGQMMRMTAKGRQVMAVTHSPQIAAVAHNHIYIEKSGGKQRAETKVFTLSHEERVRELARIISGDVISDKALANAAEMIDNAITQGEGI